MALVVNDIHSQLNRTRVDAIVKPATLDEIRACISQGAGTPWEASSSEKPPFSSTCAG
jgi:hypothetical protein